MAMFDCPDCSNKVSDKAVSCPKCGRVFTPEEIEKIASSKGICNSIEAVGDSLQTAGNFLKAISGFVFLLILLYLISIFFFSGGDDTAKTSSKPSSNSQVVSRQVEKIGLRMTPTECARNPTDNVGAGQGVMCR